MTAATTARPDPRPAACACTKTAITFEETLACPLPFRYQPGTGWVHAGPAAGAVRDFLAGRIDDAAAFRARDDATYCKECWNGQCGRHAGDRARELAYIALLRAVKDAGGDDAAIEALLSVLKNPAVITADRTEGQRR